MWRKYIHLYVRCVLFQFCHNNAKQKNLIKKRARAGWARVTEWRFMNLNCHYIKKEREKSETKRENLAYVCVSS